MDKAKLEGSQGIKASNATVHTNLGSGLKERLADGRTVGIRRRRNKYQMIWPFQCFTRTDDVRNAVIRWITLLSNRLAKYAQKGAPGPTATQDALNVTFALLEKVFAKDLSYSSLMDAVSWFCLRSSDKK